MKTHYSVGWDIGGAHVKAAVSNVSGSIIGVYQQPCPLWLGLTHLRQAVQEILQTLPAGSYQHAITMTGELVDLFAGRDDGVQQIIQTLEQLLPQQPLTVFAGKRGLVPIAAVCAADYADIASSNWLASASYAAQKIGDGVFIDVGSTTTDILCLQQGKVQTNAYTDHQRLISQELLYTGIVRTAVMAVAQTAVDQGQTINIMAEYFATMADVYRLTGELNEAHDQTTTADGGEKTTNASARRLARMIGCDFYLEELPRWQLFAENIRSQQLRRIQTAYEQVCLKTDCIKQPLIGAGVGRFLVKALADQIASPYIDFTDLCPATLMASSMDIADCAPAAALAMMKIGQE